MIAAVLNYYVPGMENSDDNSNINNNDKNNNTPEKNQKIWRVAALIPFLSWLSDRISVKYYYVCTYKHTLIDRIILWVMIMI